MGMVIVPGRNNGYPFAEGLPETPPLTPSAPFPEFFMITDGSSYPAISEIPALSAGGSPPYPEFMLQCIGSTFNSGYPLIMQLHGIQRVMFSDLRFADCEIIDIFFGAQHINSAYCNGQKVFGAKYISAAQ